MTTQADWMNRKIRGYLPKDGPKLRLREISLKEVEAVPGRVYHLEGKYYADRSQSSGEVKP